MEESKNNIEPTFKAINSQELNQNDTESNASDEFFDEMIIKVDGKQGLLRIDKFMQNRMERASRNRIQNAIRAGSIMVNEKAVKPNYKVRPNDIIKAILPKPPGEGNRIVPQDIPLDIIHEDDDLLILNKSAGMVVHPGIGHSKGTLVNALAYHFENLPVLKGNGQDKLGLVHRIDKNTSGLMVVAKSEYAMVHLSKQFYHHTIERTYNALVWGEPEELKGTIRAHVGRDPRFRKRFAAFPDGELGKWAVTHYEVLEPLYYVSLIKCNLETGRTHQIRVHMQLKGHPLFNDEKYGGDRIMKGTIFSKYKLFVERLFGIIPRHALHAKSLGFVHPTTGKEMYFESELPQDFQDALDIWRDYLNNRKAAKKIL